MPSMHVSAFSLAERFIGQEEVAGSMGNPQIMAMLQLDQAWPEDDSVPWCSAFVNYIAWLLRLPRSKGLRARSWLLVGGIVKPADGQVGFDVAVFSRGSGLQPGPSVIAAPGHVGFYAGMMGESVLVLGGNQGDAVSIAAYGRDRLLGLRRLA